MGSWPDASMPAEQAYKLMAKPGDPGFISLQETISAHSQKKALILDARESELFKEGHIPGARNLPYYEYEAKAANVLGDVPADTPIIIYCEGVTCESSFFLGRDMQKTGYTSVRIFYGGFPEWQKAGLPLEKSEKIN